MDETPDISVETPPSDAFTPPSIHREPLLSGASYTHFSAVPPSLLSDKTPCVLGVDEAGRGPVLGPMVYGLFYLPIEIERTLLTGTYSFDDSKVLTPAFRSQLMNTICSSSSDLYASCGWAVDVMAAQTISSGMLHATSMYNLNAQAMDSTIALIRGVYARGVNVREIYIDTIGNPDTYQKKLAKLFPTAKITVAKKADSLYPCVSAASVCAKVTRDLALETLYERYKNDGEDWGSGYPSDARCTNWLKRNMEPVFGWGNETRFSWGTVKDLLDAKGGKVEWPVEEDEDARRMTDFFKSEDEVEGGLGSWFGNKVSAEAF